MDWGYLLINVYLPLFIGGVVSTLFYHWIRNRKNKRSLLDFPEPGDAVIVWNEPSDAKCQSISTPYMVFYC